jgi:hypothetical protein
MKSKGITVALAATIAVTGAVKASADIIWPSEFDWVALTIGTNLYNDVPGDQSPSAIDLIGTVDSYSAGFWSFVPNGDISGGTTNDAFMFRMRVGGESGNYVWQAHLDTDGDANNVEYIFQLVQSGNPGNQGVKLIKTTVGGSTLGDISVDKKATADWSGDLNLYSRWTAIAGSSDYFVDFAIPWSEFKSITGVSELDQIRAVLATSSTHAGINKDAPLGGDLSTQISDALSDNIPEPTVASLLLGAGGGLIFYRRFRKRNHEEDDLL